MIPVNIFRLASAYRPNMAKHWLLEQFLGMVLRVILWVILELIWSEFGGWFLGLFRSPDPIIWTHPSRATQFRTITSNCAEVFLTLLCTIFCFCWPHCHWDLKYKIPIHLQKYFCPNVSWRKSVEFDTLIILRMTLKNWYFNTREKKWKKVSNSHKEQADT